MNAHFDWKLVQVISFSLKYFGYVITTQKKKPTLYIHNNLLCMLFVIYLHFLKIIRFLFTALAILKNKIAALCL